MPLVKVQPLAGKSKGNGKEESSVSLDWTSDWLEVIKSNDQQDAELLLGTVPCPDELINGSFRASSSVHFAKTKSKLDTFLSEYLDESPWWLIVARCGSMNLIQLFLDWNVNIVAQDDHGNNFVHMLVVMSAFDNTKESKYVNTLNVLMNCVDMDVKLQLLMTENREGLRPLEMCAKYECWNLFRAIISVKDVYVKEENFGNMTVCNHAITEYESFTRMFKSPIFYFLNINTKTAVFTKCLKFYHPIRTWSKLHIKAVYSFLMATIVVHGLYFVLFVVFDTYIAAAFDETVEEWNYSNQLQKSNITCYSKQKSVLVETFNVAVFRGTIIAFLVIISVFEILHWAALWITWLYGTYKRRIQDKHSICLKKNDHYATQIPLMILHTLQVMLITFLFSADLLTFHKVTMLSTITHDLLSYCVWLLSICVLSHYSTFLDSFGYYHLVVQGMAVHTGHFFLLVSIACAPFIYISERFVNRGTSLCALKFELNVATVYDIVISSAVSGAKMDDLGGMMNKRPHQADAIMMAHLVFVLLVGVILINFLIALFTFTVTEIVETKDMRLLIRRLGVSTHLTLLTELMKNIASDINAILCLQWTTDQFLLSFCETCLNERGLFFLQCAWPHSVTLAWIFPNYWERRLRKFYPHLNGDLFARSVAFTSEPERDM